MQHLEALDLKDYCSQDNPDRYNHRFPYAHLKVSHIQNMGEKSTIPHKKTQTKHTHQMKKTQTTKQNHHMPPTVIDFN